MSKFIFCITWVERGNRWVRAVIKFTSYLRDNESRRRRRTWRSELWARFSTRALRSTFRPPMATDRLSRAFRWNWCCWIGTASQRTKSSGGWSWVDRVASAPLWTTGRKFATHRADRSPTGISSENKLITTPLSFPVISLLSVSLRGIFPCRVFLLINFPPTSFLLSVSTNHETVDGRLNEIKGNITAYSC